MSYLTNPYMVKASVVTTWDQLSNDYSFLISAGDWYAMGLQIQADSTIITDPVTDVQWRYLADSGVGDGSISCCRWADTTAFTASTPATLLSQANHTYWTMLISAVGSGGMTSQTVSSSTKLSDGNIIGYLVHSGTGTYSVTGRFLENTLPSGVVPYRASASSSATYSSAPAFTITTTS